MRPFFRALIGNGQWTTAASGQSDKHRSPCMIPTCLASQGTVFEDGSDRARPRRLTVSSASSTFASVVSRQPLVDQIFYFNRKTTR